MTSPINNQPTSTSVTTTTTPTTTTTVTLGDHTISTTASGDVQTTATTTETVASASISNSSSLDEVMFSPEVSVSTEAPEAGPTGATASATSLLGTTILRTRSDSSSSTTSEFSTSTLSSELGVPHETDIEQPTTDVNVGSLEGLRGTEAAEGSARPEGPGGLPDMTIPSYDPTDKASIINFLSNPAVQSKILTKAGHLVYIDQDRGSFIFVRNGDWKLAESIKVDNGRTKQPITNPKDLEMCIAKFCMAYETMQSDWENNIHPRVAGQAGSPGNYDHLLLSLKFHTAVIYGPWNSKESSSGFTPSVWRRGTKITTGNIWGDVGGLHSVNWNQVSRPTADEGYIFNRETPTAGGTTTPTPTPSLGGFPQPVINVNLGGISTNVNVGGATTTTSVAQAETPPTTQDQTSSTTEQTDTASTAQTDTASMPLPSLDDEDTESVSSSSTQWEEPFTVEEDGNGMENMAPPPPIEAEVSTTGTSSTSEASLQNILRNIRQHLDTVYDENGAHHTGNQSLGEVVRSSENGTFTPTVLLDRAETNPEDMNTQNDDMISQNIDEAAASPTNELQAALQAVRKHLDVVYPESNHGDPVPVNQTLGQVIRDVSNGTLRPTVTDGVFTAAQVAVDDEGSSNEGTSETQAVVNAEARVLTNNATRFMSSSSSPQDQASSLSLEHLLPQLRAHLDTVYNENGDLLKPTGNDTSIGSLIQDFQLRTGSGGLVGPIPAQVVVSSSPIVQQSAITEPVPHTPAQQAVPLGEEPSKNDIYDAAQETANSLGNMISSIPLSTSEQNLNEALDMPDTSVQRDSLMSAAQDVANALSNMANSLRLTESSGRLNDALDVADNSSQGLSLLSAAREVAQSLSSTLDTITKNDT